MTDKLKLKEELVERLQRVADGKHPVKDPSPHKKRTPWRRLVSRNGHLTFSMECEGCGRLHWFKIRRAHRSLEWQQHFPQHQYYTPATAPTMEEALKKRATKGTIESILDEFSVESDEQKQST